MPSLPPGSRGRRGCPSGSTAPASTALVIVRCGKGGVGGAGAGPGGVAGPTDLGSRLPLVHALSPLMAGAVSGVLQVFDGYPGLHDGISDPNM